MPHSKPDIPLGIRCIQKLVPNVVITSSKNFGSRGLILFLTYIIYTSYHASRKPLSVVKSQLHRNCSISPDPPPSNNSDPNWCDWAPFNTEDSNSLFGLMDSAFLFSYAFAMFFSGFVAERSNLRYFLSGGVLLSGIACYLLGASREYNIHNIWYFVAVQIFGGIFQTTGWPGVVAVMGNWFGEGKTGFIFGVWNSHTSVGNILGTLIAGHYVESDWGYSFITLAYVMIGLSVIIFLFLLPEPSQPRTNGRAVNTTETDDHSGTTGSEDTDDKARVEQRPILTQNAPQPKPIGFIAALCVPGVIEFSLCLFFAKLVSYTFLYWLPFFINDSSTLGVEMSATLSTLFDVGGIFGGIFAGAVSDVTGLQACTCAFMLIGSVPSLYAYYLFGGYSLAVSITLLLVTGALVNGPYALITTAVSARLGVDPSLAENAKAISTVTAIIDGMGSIGAAVGPLMTGFVSTYCGWEYVFYMLMTADAFALLTLYRLVKNEVHKFSRARVHGWTN